MGCCTRGGPSNIDARIVCAEVILEVPTKNAADLLAVKVLTSIWLHFDGVKSIGSIAESGIEFVYNGVCELEIEGS